MHNYPLRLYGLAAPNASHSVGIKSHYSEETRQKYRYFLSLAIAVWVQANYGEQLERSSCSRVNF